MRHPKVESLASHKRPDTVAQFNLDEINSTKSLEFSDLFLVFNDAFELGNSIRAFLILANSAFGCPDESRKKRVFRTLDTAGEFIVMVRKQA